MNIRAAILDEPGGALVIEDVTIIDEPQPTEVLVKIVATGVCHTDLLGLDGVLECPMPMILGHEGSGVVEAVGSAVTKVVPGDHVVMTGDSCGTCPSCLDGAPSFCDYLAELNFGGTRPGGESVYRRADGSVVHCRFSGQSSFATHSLLSDRTVVRVPKSAPLELLGPIGCAVRTGAGGVISALNPPVGASIAIFGLGAVGLSAVMAAKLAGCKPIIGIDLNRSRLDLASDLGATHLIDATEGSVVERIQALTGGRGANYALELTGASGAITNAISALSGRGTIGLIGIPGDDTVVPLNVIDVMFHGKLILGSIQGNSVPELLIPTLVDLFEEGKLPVDRLITKYPFSDINAALEASRRGEAVKPVVTMP